MERKFYVVLIITCLFFIPISPTFSPSNNMQITDDIFKHTQGRDDGSSTSINITEIGPFKFSVETFVAPNNGTEFPVLYLKESFHINAVLSQSNGQSAGDKCLNIYIDPQENIRPISSINTNESDGMIEWFSGNSSQNPTLRGIETTGGKLEGFRLLRVAFEPDANVMGGCNKDSSGTLNGSHMDIVVLVKSRIDIQVQQSWSFVDENGISEGDLVAGEVVLIRDRLDLAVENETVSFLRQYYSYSEEWVAEVVINSTTNEQGIAGFEWEFEGRTCEGQPCPGVWRIIAHHPGSMFFAPSQDNIGYEVQYQQPLDEWERTNVVDAVFEDENWDTAMNIVEISALIISLISLLLYLVVRNKEKESDLDELAEKIVSKQKSIEKTEHKTGNTDTKTSEITQSQEQIPTMETHDSDLKQDLEDAGKNVTIVQNITYNIQDSSIVGDMNAGINPDTD